MDKIASPQDLHVELQRLLAYAQSVKPSREKLASDLRELASRLAEDTSGPLTRENQKLLNVVEEYSRGAGKVLDVEYNGTGHGWSATFDTEYAALKVYYQYVRGTTPKYRIVKGPHGWTLMVK